MLRASGTSPHLYGDGLAIWLVKASDHVEGPVFGREDKWNGLGLFFDTFQARATAAPPPRGRNCGAPRGRAASVPLARRPPARHPRARRRDVARPRR